MEPGDVIAGRFELTTLAGTGGMGQIYRARDRHTGVDVAVKMALDTSRPEDATRFEREAQALAALRHPGIVGHVAHGYTPAGRLYLAMEWVEGEDLAVRLERGPFSVAETLELGVAVAEALGAAHARGVVHRDLKPSNLLLAGGRLEAVKLLDFGVAQLPGAVRATQTGLVLGTPGYMAPEQAQGRRELDARADVFALGTILHECLAGVPAFRAQHVMALLVKIIFEEVPRLRERRPDVPPALDELVARMLAKDPAARPADGADVARLLEAVRADAGSAPSRPPAALHEALTRGEQRLLCVVLAAGEAARADPSAATLSAGDTPLDEVLHTLEMRGGEPRVLADGTIAVTLSRPGHATDQAAQAAGCALALRAALPGWCVALATGRGEIADRRPVGQAIDRAAAMVRARQRARRQEEAPAPLPPVDLDEATAGLLDLRFDVVAGAAGLELRGERHVAEGTRTLLGRATPFVGRDRELAALDSAFDACVEEPGARAVLVTGPAGVGKSRLRHELVRRLGERGGAQIWLARGDPMYAGAPFGLLGQIVRRLAHLRGGEPIEIRRAQLAARVARRVAAPERARVTEFLGEMVGTPFPDDDRVQLRASRGDPRILGDQMRRAWVELVAAECAAQPVVLLLEDAHWGDQPSLEYVDAALRLLADRPLLAVALGRPELHERFPRLWAERSAEELRLGQLPRRACERLIRDVLGDAVPADVVARLWERSAGNAFFLEELLRATAEGRGGDLPDTVVAMLESRLATLHPDDRRFLRAGSVFGEIFWRGGAAALLGGGESDAALDARAARLEQAECITPRPEAKFPGERELGFRHALLREAAYGMLTDDDRALGHRLAGAWLEAAGEPSAVVLAGHFERGGEPGRAVLHYRRAAEQALEGNDLESAIRLVERAAALGATGEALGHLALARASAHVWRDEFDEAGPWVARALEELPSGGAPWYAAVRVQLWVSGNAGDAARLAELGALLLAEGRPEAAGARVMAMALAAEWLTGSGRYDEARALREAIDPLAGAFEHDAKVAAELLLERRVRAYYAGDAGQYREIIAAAVTRLEEAGDLRQACLHRGALAGACNDLGAYHEAVATARATLVEADRLELPLPRDTARYNLGFALAHLGAFDEARAVLGASVTSFVAHGPLRLEGCTRAYLAVALLLAGEPAEAEPEARRAVEALAATPPLLPFARAVLAQALLAQGRAVEAREEAWRAFEQMASLDQIEEGEARVRLVFAEAMDATGDRDAACAVLEAARERLLGRAAAITDPASRQGFLERVPENARTLALAAAWLGE